jgi:3-hydroxyacyl-CoA dehydrogenase
VIESSKPFVAALHGNALGGGFELALACDARLAAPGTNVGLPEVGLGMIPGAGGTQHLPRLIGIAAAIEMICSARRIRAEEALPMGLIDHIAEVDLRTAAVEDALALRGCKRRLRDLPIPRESDEKVDAAAEAARSRGESAPQVIAAIEAIKSSATMPYPQAMAREREVFQALRNSDNARALRQKFFAERAAKKV